MTEDIWKLARDWTRCASRARVPGLIQVKQLEMVQ